MLLHCMMAAIVFGQLLSEGQSQYGKQLYYTTSDNISVYVNDPSIRFFFFITCGFVLGLVIPFFEKPRGILFLLSGLGLLLWLIGNIMQSYTWVNAVGTNVQAYYIHNVLIDHYLVVYGGALFYWSVYFLLRDTWIRTDPIGYWVFVTLPPLYMLVSLPFTFFLVYTPDGFARLLSSSWLVMVGLLVITVHMWIQQQQQYGNMEKDKKKPVWMQPQMSMLQKGIYVVVVFACGYLFFLPFSLIYSTSAVNMRLNYNGWYCSLCLAIGSVLGSLIGALVPSSPTSLFFVHTMFSVIQSIFIGLWLAIEYDHSVNTALVSVSFFLGMASFGIWACVFTMDMADNTSSILFGALMTGSGLSELLKRDLVTNLTVGLSISIVALFCCSVLFMSSKAGPSKT